MNTNLHSTTGVERRRQPRLYEPFPALVRGVDAGSSEPFRAGTVLDNLSTSGLYLRLAQKVAPATNLSIVTRLSNAPPDEARGAVVAIKGVVQRAEPQSDG